MRNLQNIKTELNTKITERVALDKEIKTLKAEFADVERAERAEERPVDKFNQERAAKQSPIDVFYNNSQKEGEK